jgi:hypothetical protein
LHSQSRRSAALLLTFPCGKSVLGMLGVPYSLLLWLVALLDVGALRICVIGAGESMVQPGTIQLFALPLTLVCSF